MTRLDIPNDLARTSAHLFVQGRPGQRLHKGKFVGPWDKCVAFFVSALLAACVVNTENAPCTSDENCPNGQICVESRCKRGEGGGKTNTGGDGGGETDGGTGGNDGGGCQSDPACKFKGPVCDPGGDPNKTGTCVEVSKGCLKVQGLAACPSRFQTCDAGACVCPSAACTPGKLACGGPDGGQLVNCFMDAVDGCAVRSDFGTGCPEGTLCVPDAGGAQCLCPPEAVGTPRIGTGCRNASTLTACGVGGVLECRKVGTSCWRWEMFDPCATLGLDCSPPVGLSSATCVCPPNPSRIFYADPVHGSRKSAAIHPTGVKNPPACHFRTLGDALEAAAAAGGIQVVATGLPYPRWQATTYYERDSLIVPTWADGGGLYYRAVADAGTPAWVSGSQEPDWSAGGDVQDNGILWAPEWREDTVNFFTETTFPLVAPANTKVTTDDCLAGGNCSQDKYHVALFDLSVNPVPAVELSTGSTWEGLHLYNFGGKPASPLVRCATGAVNLAHVEMIGSGNSTLQVGLLVTGTCQMVASDLYVASYSAQAIRIEGADAGLQLAGSTVRGDEGSPAPGVTGIRAVSGSLTANSVDVSFADTGIDCTGATTRITGGTIHDNLGYGVRSTGGTTDLLGTQVLANGSSVQTYPGVEARGGSLTIQAADIGKNSGQGIAVDDTVSFNIADTLVHDNGLTGVIILRSALPISGSSVSMTGTKIHDNNFAVPANIAGGVRFDATVNLISFRGNEIHDNNGDQLRFQAPPFSGPWVVGTSDCSAGVANRIYRYGCTFPPKHPLPGVGINNASTGSVFAAGVYWEDDTNPSSGQDFLGNFSVASGCPWAAAEKPAMCHP